MKENKVILTDKELHALSELIDAIHPDYGPTVDTRELQDKRMGMTEGEMNNLYAKLNTAEPIVPPVNSESVISTSEYWNMYNKQYTLNEAGMDIAAACQKGIREVMDSFHQYNPREIFILFTEMAVDEAGSRLFKRIEGLRQARRERKLK